MKISDLYPEKKKKKKLLLTINIPLTLESLPISPPFFLVGTGAPAYGRLLFGLDETQHRVHVLTGLGKQPIPGHRHGWGQVNDG